LLLVLSGNMLMDALEVSTIVIALPSIGGDLRLTPSQTSWFMTGFALGFGGFILLGRPMTEALGRRRVYLWALAVFAVASLVGGLAADGGMLAATRVVKGVCVALTAPTGLAIIAGTFPEGPSRNRAVSVYSLFGASGFSVGLLLSGALTLLSWRWSLLFSAPVALLLLAVGLRLIPDDTAGGGPVGTGSPSTLGSTARLLRSAAGAAAMNGPYWGFLLMATHEMQSERGWSPLVTGLALLPTSLPLAVSAVFSGRLVSRFGTGRLIAAGSVLTVLGYAWYLARDPHRAYLPDVLPTVVLVGAGFVASFAALHIQAVTGVPPRRQGIVGGVYQTSVQVGGAAMLMAVAAVLSRSSHRPALIAVTLVATAGVAIAVAGLTVRQPRNREERHASQPDPSHSDHRKRAGRPAGSERGPLVRGPG
jgi:MFS family permease